MRMKWVRSHIKYGSRLALLALVIQFAVSFSHCHAIAAQAITGVQSGVAPAQQPSPTTHDTDQQTNDACQICAVIALANTTLFATPPLLVLPHAVELSCVTTGAEVVHSTSARVAFQPRAPPVS
jgi:hypothetical protein